MEVGVYRKLLEIEIFCLKDLELLLNSSDSRWRPAVNSEIEKYTLKCSWKAELYLSYAVYLIRKNFYDKSQAGFLRLWRPAHRLLYFGRLSTWDVNRKVCYAITQHT
jgi:hypothetical protein